ncbi:unnamed protein product [Dibothriocephalus latus]|uniref:Uncharacterized protein n=1 Tax=Dibothriocephalus latus TaxID=60516 RepID=A0A3P7P3F9_DIBLA|nr:unnamed protein product [Dibothriocephalus latus]
MPPAAVRRHIPNGHIHLQRPNYTSEGSRLERERDDKQARDASDPRILKLNALNTKTINDGKRQRLHRLVADCNFCKRTGPTVP